MEKITEQRIAAGAKIAFGVIRMGGAIATGTGHGVIAGILRNHGMTRAALPIAKSAFLGGKRMFVEGLADWKDTQ